MQITLHFYILCIGCIDEDIRLVGGSNKYEGRVEVCVNNTWGTVCDDFWETADAQVVCRQLGYSTYNVEKFTKAHFGQGNGSIYMDDVSCVGTESSLFSCIYTHYTSDYFNCEDHSEDAGVRCGSGKL